MNKIKTVESPEQNQLDVSSYTRADKELIFNTVAKGCTASEFKLFLNVCTHYKLNPILKEAWCIKYGSSPAQIFAGRDGFRAIANRTGLFDGCSTSIRRVEDPIKVKNFKETEKTVDRPWQYVATATVYKKYCSHPFVCEVWEEEYNNAQSLWASKPKTMLKKVAEAQAMKMAFNISGIYHESEQWPDRNSIEEKAKHYEMGPSEVLMMERGVESIKVENKKLKDNILEIANRDDESGCGVAEVRDRIDRMIEEEFGGTTIEKMDNLEEISKFTSKEGAEIPGVRVSSELKGKRLFTVYGKIKAMAKTQLEKGGEE